MKRGEAVESRHRVSASLRFADSSRDASHGDPGLQAFWRSALKPFQALAVVEAGVLDAYGLDAVDLALICASHGGTVAHTNRVARILERIGAGESDLHCGPHPPYDIESERRLQEAGESPSRLHNNCSGKHASMVALALHCGWDPTGYWKFEHPAQERMRRVLADWIDSDPEGLVWATDGCGVPTPLIRLDEMAGAYLRLGDAFRRSVAAPRAVVEAMTDHPELTSSSGREPLVIMQATSGRLLAKEGAEGVLCVTSRDEAWGLALKVEDGTRRATGPAAVRLLGDAGLLRANELRALEPLARVPILSTRDEVVGTIESGGPEETRSG